MISPADVQVVVLMGGLGTRLKEYTKECPKSLVDVCGRPFFDHQLDLLTAWGFHKFLFLIGYRADMIEDHYGDGRDRNISIQYSYDGEKLLGTGGAVRRAYDLLEDDFLLIYGDSFMDIDYAETIYRYERGKSRGARALMTVLRNNNRFDKSNVVMREGKIVLYDKHEPTPEMEYIDYGVCMYEKSLFSAFGEDEAFDISVIQHDLSVKGQMTAQIVTKRFYEIGSPASYKEFSGYVTRRFEESHPAVFLDRDGVINSIVWNDDIDQLDSPMKVSEFEFLPGAASAIKTFKEKGYYVFIVTNQPGAAKGKTDLATLYDINTYMISSLAGEGAEIDDLFMCPHYTKELPMTKESFLIRECNCRKPKPGLIYRAMRKYSIDMSRSYMIGDSCTDMAAGAAAGLRTVFIGDLKCDLCKKLGEEMPMFIAKDIVDAASSVEDVR
ncbi:MAG: HAD-IIIA family hydrolase [Lachnospiraceae bacterium]|nr:HAD-IIIA family hydrolase [Lachnospiraceae bacterium]